MPACARPLQLSAPLAVATDAEINWGEKRGPFLPKICCSCLSQWPGASLVAGAAGPVHQAQSLGPPSPVFPCCNRGSGARGTQVFRDAGVGRMLWMALSTANRYGTGTGGLKGDARATSLTVNHCRAHTHADLCACTHAWTYTGVHTHAPMCKRRLGQRDSSRVLLFVMTITSDGNERISHTINP